MSFTASTSSPFPESFVGPLPSCTHGPLPIRPMSGDSGSAWEHKPPTGLVVLIAESPSGPTHKLPM